MKMIHACPKCRCGCGRDVSNWTLECYPQPPWDAPGLAPRAMGDRCSTHKHCAYRDDDPARCPVCHTLRKCDCVAFRGDGEALVKHLERL